MAGTRMQAAPDLGAQQKVNIFNKIDFDAAIWGLGYDVVWEKALRCPCSGSNHDNKPSCGNCLGLGWIFLEPIQTKAFITSINKSTTYKDWSPELVGTIAITFMDTNRFGYMDKVSLIKNSSVMSEVLRVRNYNGTRFVFCTYKPSKINYMYMYLNDGQKLYKVSDENFTISSTNPYVVILNPGSIPTGTNEYISIYYSHNIIYNVIDIPHDMRITKQYSADGKKKEAEMPIQAIARKSQYELGAPTNLSGDNLIINDTTLAQELIDFNQDFSRDMN